MTARVSVVIPCYNSAHLVRDAVASVVAQEEPGVEVLVVDDGSQDRDALEAALEPFKDGVRLLCEEHRGVSATRNRGIEVARAPFVAFLDADDIWMPGFLQRQLTFLESSNADLVYCDARLFGPRASDTPTTVMDKFPSRGEVTLPGVLTKECQVVMSTVVARTDAVRAAGGFDPDLGRCEDLDLWVRMLEQGARLAYHRDVLVRRRVHGHNVSSNAMAMAEAAHRVVFRYADHPGLDARARRAVRRHLLSLEGEFHLERAKVRLTQGDGVGARGDLWRAFLRRRNLKALAGATALTLMRGKATAFLAARYAAEAKPSLGAP